MADKKTPFERFTNHKVSKDGTRYEIECSKGLWGVSAPNQEIAVNEAQHYFMQYWSDGEYGQNTTEALLKKLRII